MNFVASAPAGRPSHLLLLLLPRDVFIVSTPTKDGWMTVTLADTAGVRSGNTPVR